MIQITLSKYEVIDLLWVIAKATDSLEVNTDNLNNIRRRIHAAEVTN